MLSRATRKEFPYILAVGPVNKPLTLAEVKDHLILDIADTSEDDYLNFLIDAVAEFGEKYVRRDFITRTYETYRDDFCDSLELRKNPVQSVSKVERLVDDVLTEVPTTVYFATLSNTYPHLSLKVSQSWPTDADNIEQAVKITFVAGFGDDSTDIPDKYKNAMLAHIAFIYENRGDCEGDGGEIELLMPKTTKLIYDTCRIRTI
jgi:uncharacterized phiE125 gp8 family phage protein